MINFILRKSRKNLRIRTLIIIIIILFLSTGMSTLFLMAYVNSSLKKSISNEIHASGLVIKSLYNNLNNFSLDSFKGMDSLLKNIAKSNKKISYCFISNISGKIVYHSNKSKKGEILNSENYSENYIFDKKQTLEKGIYIENLIPIINEKRVYGYIHIGVKKNLIRSKILSLIIITSIILFVAFIISILMLSYFLDKKVISPITKLSMKIKNTSEKMKFDEKIKVQGDDEVSELGKAFNLLLNQLKNYSENMEEIVNHRTKELDKANDLLASKNKKMLKELKMAEILQSSILPNELPEIEGIDIATFYVAMDQIGGDYFDIFKLDGNKLGFLIADVSGHGVPAALVTMMVKVAFVTYSKYNFPCDIILEKVNKDLVKILGIEVIHYVTAFYLKLDYEYNFIQISSAGHPNQVLYKKETNEIINMRTYGRFLGIDDKSIYGKKNFLLKKGDRIILFTDGIIEARNENNKFYSYNRLKDFILNNSSLNAKDFIDKLKENIDNFCDGMKQTDDMAIIVIDIKSNRIQDSIINQLNKRMEEIKKLKNTSRQLYKKNKIEQAVNLLIQAMHKEGKTDSHTMIDISRYLIDYGNLEDAAVYLEYAVSLEPENYQLRMKFYELYDKIREDRLN